jgi:hypothetical protein
MSGRRRVEALARHEQFAVRLVSDEEEPSSDAPKRSPGSHRCLRTTAALNRTFAFLGVAATASSTSHCSTPIIPTP